MGQKCQAMLGLTRLVLHLIPLTGHVTCQCLFDDQGACGAESGLILPHPGESWSGRDRVGRYTSPQKTQKEPGLDGGLPRTWGIEYGT